jgi:elongation factor 2 kinase
MTVTCECDTLSRYVPGEFKKFNNNWDWAEDKRNTPQAFSHWTLKYTNGRYLVCDIQGVGDVWTDPQIHTSYNTNDFGLGNCFQEGIDKFMQVRACLCSSSASTTSKTTIYSINNVCSRGP